MEMVERNRAMARSLGYPSVPAEKRAVAQAIGQYVERGGFLFAMCTATETLDLALASDGVDIAAAYADGSPMDAERHGGDAVGARRLRSRTPSWS